MAVKLETTTKRWVALSTDIKPGVGTSEVIPIGSRVEETDTGRIYRWDGELWTVYVPEDEHGIALELIRLELVRTRLILEHVYEVDSDELIG